MNGAHGDKNTDIISSGTVGHIIRDYLRFKMKWPLDVCVFIRRILMSIGITDINIRKIIIIIQYII